MERSARYRLIRLIKRGGNAELFEARVDGPQGFVRRVAVKRLLPELAGDEAMLQRFVDEARIISHLHHANIVGVFDFGVMDGLPFQVLELVDGVDLATLAERAGTIPANVALYVTAQIAHALDYAHTARGPSGEPLGIVHRDVSPENILVSRAGDVKLADFGIARAFERRAPTEINVVHGKPPFMAPERLRGEVADARSDLFSLGCVLHAMLAGESPIAREDVRKNVAAGGRVPLASALPAAVREIVARATATAKADRHPSAAELAADCARTISTAEARSALAALVARCDPAPEPRHPLEALMNVEILLEESSPPELRRFVSVAREPARADPLIGRTAGEHTLISPLGRGGFATVYRGRHLVSRREHAVKVLALGAPPEREIRFRREADALARLDHPNLVRIEGSGALEDGRAYIVMELVEGRTLGATIAAAQFDDRRALHVARQIASALAAAHALGFIHRDLKPSNVMVTAPGDHVKVLDFGVALLLDTAHDQTRLTAAGRIVGTPRWMAPEQVRGGPVDARADLYALGLVMFAMLNGKAPFDGGTDDVMDAHLEQRPPPLPRDSVLEPLITRLLEKDPERRTATAAEVVVALDRIAAEQGWPAPESPAGPTSAVTELTATTVPETLVVSRTAKVAIRVDRPRPVRAAAVALGVAALAAVALVAFARIAGRSPPATRTPEPRPAAVAVPSAVAVASEPAPPEPEPQPQPEEAPLEPARKVKRRSPADEGAGVVRLERLIETRLDALVLRWSDLADHDATRASAAAARDAREHGDARAQEQALEALAAAIDRLPRDAAYVRRRLARAQAMLEKNASRLDAAALAELERRYLDVRAAIPATLAPPEADVLARRLDDLERDIVTRRRE